MRTLVFVTGAVALLCGECPDGRAASFDCARAAAPDERAVCADPQLSAFDTALGRAYAEARAATKPEGIPALLAMARHVLADRRLCGPTRACLLAVYMSALRDYQNYGSTVAAPENVTAAELAGGQAPDSTALPTRLGRCVTTRVVSVTPRLEGEPPGSFQTGTAINFGNGGHQVSYETEPKLIASRPGDRAVMCLTAVPHDCPRGDDRGKVYDVTNLRTGGSWSLPDLQHSCGGA